MEIAGASIKETTTRTVYHVYGYVAAIFYMHTENKGKRKDKLRHADIILLFILYQRYSAFISGDSLLYVCSLRLFNDFLLSSYRTGFYIFNYVDYIRN